MKKLSLLLALTMLLFADLALAAGAVVTSLTGVAQVQTGSAAPRALRQGDPVAQGDTVFTGPASSVVLKFDDGQVAALSANSRMQVTAYAYNPETRSGNVLLSLVVGGMRALTGLIGHNQPQNVNFRVATATIGIRGSEGEMVTNGVTVALVVTVGEFTFTFNGDTVTVTAGRGVFGVDGRIIPGTLEETVRRLTPEDQRTLGDLDALTKAINDAAPGVPSAVSVTIPASKTTPGGAGGGGGAVVNPTGSGPPSPQ